MGAVHRMGFTSRYELSWQTEDGAWEALVTKYESRAVRGDYEMARSELL